MHKQDTKSKKSGIGFSIVGSGITILFFVFINFTVGGKFPWFIFPSYAILWWPLALIFGPYSGYTGKLLSLVGSLLTIVLLVTVNYLTSWGYPWFLYPSFAILWWPVMMFWGKQHKKAFSVAGSLTVIVFALILNFTFSPSDIWFYYPAVAVMWWPLGLFFQEHRMRRGYSIAGALFLLIFLSFENFVRSPGVPWALFAYYPVLMWPVSVFLKKSLGKPGITMLCSLSGIVYYTVLNLFIFKGFPWAIYPVYGILWWPMAVFAPKRAKELYFSLFGTVLTSFLFIATNLIASPGTVWAVYPIFALSWWPLSVYYFVYRRRKVENVNFSSK